MKCPKCNIEFSEISCDDVKIKYCRKCGAVWITFTELKKISEKLDLKIPLVNPAKMHPVKIKEEVRRCPECGKDADKVYFNGIVADICQDCNSILFDDGELSKYFNLFMKKPAGIINNLLFINKYFKYCNGETNQKGVVMSEIEIQSKEKEKIIISINGFFMLFVMVIWALIVIICFIYMLPILAFILLIPLIVCCLGGFKMLKPQEAMVLTVFGKYVGTLKGEGFHFVNPFAAAPLFAPKISLKARTLDSGKQKINDELGNPIEVGIIVIWEVRDTAKAVFNVEDYTQFLASQCDSALRTIVRMYPYDAPDDSNLQSLRGDSQEISSKLKTEIQNNVNVAGLYIVDAKITHLAYAPEIAVAMLQRQQAVAVLDAKKAIVEGAVSMVETALNKLCENNIVELDKTEKAKMVNNLLVTLCSNKEAQPVIRNG